MIQTKTFTVFENRNKKYKQRDFINTTLVVYHVTHATDFMQVTLKIDFQNTNMQPERKIGTTEYTLKRYIIVELEQ